MKTLEDLSAQYDKTVRNSARAVIQFRYGDDGLHPVMMESGVAPVNLELLFKQVCSEGTHERMMAATTVAAAATGAIGQATVFLEPTHMLNMASKALQDHFKVVFNFNSTQNTNGAAYAHLKLQELERAMFPRHGCTTQYWIHYH